MAGKKNPFAPRSATKPRSQLSQHPDTKRHRRLAHTQSGLTAAIGRACTNAHTRKSRAHAALAKSAEWTALTEEEQNSRVHTAEHEIDLKLQDEMNKLEASWNEKIGRNTDEEEEVLEDSDDESDSGEDMEDGLVDADADEPLFDAHGNPIVSEALDNIVELHIRASKARLAKVFEQFEKVGSFDEPVWESEDDDCYEYVEEQGATEDGEEEELEEDEEEEEEDEIFD